MSPYAYCLNNPLRYTDPTGKWVESVWDIANVSLGFQSLHSNIQKRNYWEAVADGIGLTVDIAATLLPGVPAGAGVAIDAVRSADKAIDAVKAADRSADAVKAMRRGVENEAKVLREMGELKNTKRMNVVLQETGKKISVTPDAINSTTIFEVKDAKSVYNTKQIRGERQAAQDLGRDFKIVTGEKTHVSGSIPVEEIVRRKDIGPQ